jgi:hypothetical protein
MRHRLTILAIFSCLFVANAFAHGAGNDAMNRCHLDWHRNSAWPKPFTLIDRQGACSPFALMATRGWQRQSTITNYHFDHVTQQLTEAGQLKVLEILKTNPRDQRMVVMVRGRTDQDTASRRESIAEVAINGTRDRYNPQIMEIDIEPRAWPAEEIEAIGNQWNLTMPKPRLSDMQSTVSGDL